MVYFLTLDVGTTSVKSALFGEDLTPVGFSSREYQLLTPGKDLVELDPETYWEAARAGIRSVLKETGVAPGAIKTLTITTQGETLIPVDRDGKPLHYAVVWMDGRAVEEAEFISRMVPADKFYQMTGLPEVGPACPVAKVLWFKRNRPEIYQQTAKFLLLEDYFVHRLTGAFVTESSLMSSTGYFDVHRNVLWAEILTLVGVDRTLFPDVVPCSQKVGKLRPEVAEELGLWTETQVVTGAMDQIAAAIGAGNVRPGMVTETTGTALVIAATMDEFNPSRTGQVSVYKHFDGKFLLLPYCPTAGMILKWFKDEFCREETEESERRKTSVYQLLDEMAEKVPPGADGLLLVPHLAGKLNPDINPHAKGVWFGLGLDTKKRQMIRAILEAVGFMLRENLELIERNGIQVREIRSLGGASKSPVWSGIKAEISGKTIHVMEVEEATSLGAAILGAVAAGIYSSVDEACQKAVRIRRTFVPNPENRKLYEKSYQNYLQLYARLQDFYKEAEGEESVKSKF